MRRFKSTTQAQRFLESHAAVYNLFNLHRHSLCRRYFKLFGAFNWLPYWHRDGTTHILFTPEDFLARLAALVPRPRSNLTRYFYRIGGSLRPTRHSGGQWFLVQRNRRATNQRNRQYRPPLKPLSIKHCLARY